MSAVVNPRGQITVDRAIRKALGVTSGMVAVQQVLDGQLVITFIPAPHRRSAAGILGSAPRNAHLTMEQARAMAEESIAADAVGGIQST